MVKKKTAKLPTVNVGDYVLIGRTQASYPSHWYIGEVLWQGEGDVLVRRSLMTGASYRDHISLFDVRAVGSISELNAVKKAAAERVGVLQMKINDAEQVLGAARDALWAELGRTESGVLPIIPPDFDAIEADRVATQALVEAADAELGE